MSLDPLVLFYGAVFLAVLLLVQGLYVLYADRRAGREAVNRRMRMLASRASTHEVFETLRRRPRDRSGVFGPLASAGRRLDRVIRHAGLPLSVRRVLAVMAGLSLTAFFASVALLMAPGRAGPGGPAALALALAASLGLGVVAPIFYLKHRKSRRLGLFVEQLPEALDVMVRSLRAGHPVSAAMAMVARELPDPIGTEFAIVVDEMTYGLDLRDALANLARRVDLDDLRYVVVAINIQHDTGGNLAEILHGLAMLIRARFRLAKKIRALSAEARLSAKMLAAMPFVFGGLVFAANPGFYLEVADDPLFLPVLGLAFALEGLGVYIMRRLVRFRI
ncbi:MAG: type II secretion system F family protein [Kiloniellaceae bacterium]